MWRGLRVKKSRIPGNRHSPFIRLTIMLSLRRIAVNYLGEAEDATWLGAPGIVMSIGITGPKDESGLSNSDWFPTTRVFIWSLWRYFFATRSTSAVVTFSTPARYC